MVSTQRTVATIRPTYHKRQKSGALAAIIRRNGELLTRSLPPRDGLPVAFFKGRTGFHHPRERGAALHAASQSQGRIRLRKERAPVQQLVAPRLTIGAAGRLAGCCRQRPVTPSRDGVF
jgi:hypothetical protein